MAGDAATSRRDFVIVGNKPVMNYVVACLTLFNSGSSRVRLRARGRHISKAVDVVEMIRRVFLRDLRVEKIELGTDNLTRPDGGKASVSTMEIRILKP